MTLGEAKTKTFMLMDEYSSNGVITADRDIALRMNRFFDTAQKNLARIRRIVKRYTVPYVSGVTEYPMPGDFMSARRTWVDGAPRCVGEWVGSTLITDEACTVEYNAYPVDITDFTPDSYTFEIAPDAQECMPYWVASRQLVSDIVLDYKGLLGMYESMAAQLEPDGRVNVRCLDGNCGI